VEVLLRSGDLPVPMQERRQFGVAVPVGLMRDERVGLQHRLESIAQARRLTRLANCTFSDGIAEALDAPDGSYDVVVSSLTIHHLPESLRPQAIREMFRVLVPGGSVLIAEFRPPTSRFGRRIISAIHSPVMANNRLDPLQPMLRQAGFEQLRSGDLYPWIHYVQALKPANSI
jgi:SAM-dependent methyltransferase